MNAGQSSLLRSVLYHRIRTYVSKFFKQSGGMVFRPMVLTGKTSKFLFAGSFPSFLVVKALPWKKASETDPNKDITQQADMLYDTTQFDDLYALLSPHVDSQDPEILWRLARALFEKCRKVKDSAAKLALYEEALNCVTKALEADETCWAAHKWMAILLDHVWRFKSTKGRILHSFEVRKHMERAIELNPKDSTSYYLLGEWCFTFAELPWYQRKAAAVIFASPPTSTYEEALQYFEEAEKITPNFYSMNLLMMGKCLVQLGQKERAIDYLKQAIDYPQKTADDIQAHSEAEELLKKLI